MEEQRVYAVFEGYGEMLYGYPPRLRGLFTTKELAETVRDQLQGQAQDHEEGQPYVAAIPVRAEAGPTDDTVGLGFAEWPGNDNEEAGG